MKKIWFKSVLLALAGFMATSCGDFLEIYPLTMVYEDNYWNEKKDVDQIVYGCYTRMQDADYLKRVFMWGEVRSDNIGQATRSDVGYNWQESYVLREDILSKNPYTSWTCFYDVINRCNLVIDRAPKVAEKDPLYLESDVRATIAEVTALRALSYFYLVRAFKDVPYYTGVITTDDQRLDYPATDGDQIIRTLLSDLNAVLPDALQIYPMKNGRDISYGRITRNAIYALMADMSLWIGDFENAALYSQKVIDDKLDMFNREGLTYILQLSNNYPILPDNTSTYGKYLAFNETFGSDGGGLESIFELDFSSDEGDGSKENTMVADFMYGYNDKDVETQGIYKPSEPLYKTNEIFLDEKDSRILESYYVDDPTNPGVYFIQKFSAQTMSTSGYALMRGKKNDGNWMFYRTSDVMLMQAEALIYMLPDEFEYNADESKNDSKDHPQTVSGRVDKALELIKTIADRSATNGQSTIATSGYSSKIALLELLYAERRREFLFEGKRWFDLVRWARHEGSTERLANFIAEKFTSGSSGSAIGNLRNNAMRMYWPYNYDEMKANKNLIQNPAYPEMTDSYESTN